MEKSRLRLITQEEIQNSPILIIDKRGILGNELASKLREQFLIVLVSGKEIESHENIIHIPHHNKIPVIPDNIYSHIFIFYNGEEAILDMLPIFMKKANETNGKIFFLTSLIYSSESLFKRLSHHLYNSLGILLYGEVFDEKIRHANTLNLFIYQAKKHGRLEISNEGLNKLYPVYMSDLLVVIIAAAFGNEFKKGNLFIFPKYPFTEISAAHVFQKINPDIRIDFSKKRVKEANYFIPKEGVYVFSNYKLEQSLRKMDLNMSKKKGSSEANKPIHKIEPKKPVVKKQNSFKWVLKWALAVLIAPIAIVILSVIFGASSLTLSLNQAEAGKFAQASSFAKFGKYSFSTAVVVTDNYFPANIVGNVKEEISRKLRVGEQIADIEVNLFTSLVTFSDIYNGKSDNPKEEFKKSLANIKNTLLKFDEMQAQNQLPTSMQEKLDENRYMISLFQNSIDTFSPVLGFEGKRKYLVLFQNNMELRSGGGFIGSYGVLEIDKGRVGKFDIHDVYEADGKLKTHIEPPYGLRRYGGVSHFFLRDSNFDVESTNSAAAAADILQRETGDRIDGIIAVDTNFIKNILSTLGTVTVEDYKEQVTAGNFYMLTQKHAEDNFFPGSTQKKDFLTSLYKSIKSNIFEKKNISYSNLAKAIDKSIKEKHLFFVFVDPKIQKIFTVNNLSASLWDGRKGDNNSFMDFFGVIDANIGANKSNYYLKREVAQNVLFTSNGEMQASAIVNYENTSTKQSVFGGDYKNYVRFVLPAGADLKSVSVDDKELVIRPAITDPSIFGAKGFIPPKELEIESTTINGKEMVGFLLIVPVSTTKKVTISYTVPQLINTDSPEFSYNLRVFKQAGTDQDPYSLTLSYPTKFQPVDLSKSIIDLGGKLVYETKLTTDKDINIKFSQR